MPGSEVVTCYCCGTVLDADNLAWDYLWPDDLAALPAQQRDAVLRFQSRSFIVADGFGAAARVMLPIRLDTGHTATLGVWLGITGGPEEADRVAKAGRAGGEAWAGCTFNGVLLNEVRPWPIYLAPATAVAPAANTLAHLVDSPHETLRRVLTEAWPHTDVIGARRPQ